MDEIEPLLHRTYLPAEAAGLLVHEVAFDVPWGLRHLEERPIREHLEARSPAAFWPRSYFRQSRMHKVGRRFRLTEDRAVFWVWSFQALEGAVSPDELAAFLASFDKRHQAA